MNTIMLRASQQSISYEGEGAGPVVVMLHAFPLDSSIWRHQQKALADEYHVLAPDFPGFGSSPAMTGLTVDAAADVVAELLDHLGINERVAVCGLSMGGYVALAIARLYPQRLRALILADTKADADDAAAKAGRDRIIELVSNEGPKSLIDELIPKLLGAQTINNRPEVVENVRAIAERQNAEGITSALRAMRDRPDATPGLAHVSVPTLVIVGEDDTVTPPEKAKSLADGILGATLVTIPAVGHLSNLEDADAFTSAVRQFLQGLPEDVRASRTV